MNRRRRNATIPQTTPYWGTSPTQRPMYQRSPLSHEFPLAPRLCILKVNGWNELTERTHRFRVSSGAQYVAFCSKLQRYLPP
jgi:hypothetical protein